jgi:hypothetical protein
VTFISPFDRIVFVHAKPHWSKVVSIGVDVEVSRLGKLRQG